MWIYILIIAFVILYLIGSYKLNHRENYRLPEKYSKVWRVIHFIVLVLSLIALVLNVWYNLDFRGLWTTRIFVIILLFTGIFYSPVCSKPKRIITDFYFNGFSSLPALSGVLLLIPFIGAIIFITYTEKLISPAGKILLDDNKTRIITRSHGPLGPNYIDVFKKEGIFEKALFSTPWRNDSIYINYNTDSIHLSLKDGKYGVSFSFEIKNE